MYPYRKRRKKNGQESIGGAWESENATIYTTKLDEIYKALNGEDGKIGAITSIENYVFKVKGVLDQLVAFDTAQ